MALVNVTNSYNALNPYAGEFWTAAEKARQQTLSSQSQNKPHL
jgi:hypothetical protein